MLEFSTLSSFTKHLINGQSKLLPEFYMIFNFYTVIVVLFALFIYTILFRDNQPKGQKMEISLCSESEVGPGLTGKITYLAWPGSSLGYPRTYW